MLYISKTKDGKILFDQTKGLFVVDDDFTTVTEIPTEKNVTGNRLKFLVDGDNHSRLIAENMGMQPDDVENIYYIALLHDIGKIAIPDSILNKPGRLTDEEFKVMKSHTTRGAEILKGISTIPQIIEGAKSHHERYDGSGYPEGLSGENIPFAARIICCADCFDAMASRRVYKEPFSQDVIIKEFERCSGTQFDPTISKIVIGMISSGKLKPYSADDIYLGSDGKTHRIKKASENQQDL